VNFVEVDGHLYIHDGDYGDPRKPTPPPVYIPAPQPAPTNCSTCGGRHETGGGDGSVIASGSVADESPPPWYAPEVTDGGEGNCSTGDERCFAIRDIGAGGAGFGVGMAFWATRAGPRALYRIMLVVANATAGPGALAAKNRNAQRVIEIRGGERAAKALYQFIVGEAKVNPALLKNKAPALRAVLGEADNGRKLVAQLRPPKGTTSTPHRWTIDVHNIWSGRIEIKFVP
jgi:hypothetical protein